MDLESRTRATLKQFDSNMSGIFDRASFYDSDLYSQASFPQLSKAQKCFKYSLVAVSGLFLIFGAVLTSVGAAAVNNKIGELAGSTLPTGITVMGVFIILVSLLGALASWKESRFFLAIYWVFLFLFTIILFFVSIAVYVEKDSAADLITEGWDNASLDVRSSLESVFTCCGLNTFDSSNCPSVVLNKYNATCANSEGVVTDSTCMSCSVEFLSTFESYYQTAGACGIAFAVIMLSGLFFICFLMKAIKKKRAEQDFAKLRAQQPAEDSVVEPEPLGEEEEEGAEGEDDEEEAGRV